MDNLGDRLRQLTSIAQRFGGRGGADKFKQSAGNASNGIVALLALAGLGFGLYKGIFSVESGHRAIKFNRISGVGAEIYSEGYHFAVPILERPIIYDIRTRANSITSLTGSKDLQMVNLTVRVLHKPNEKQLSKMYRELGMNYAERVLPSLGNEVLKSVVAQFTAAELLSKRQNVSALIRKKLTERATNFGVIVDDVSIVDLAFGKEYSAAVEAKQVAKQEADRSRFWVQKALEEKKSMMIKAQGDAESIRLVSEALAKSQGFLELRRLEAAKEIAGILADGNGKVYLNSETLLVNLVGTPTDVVTQKQ